MASPSYWWTFGHETDQTLQNKQELVIRSCSRVSSGAEVIIDAFETKRPISDRGKVKTLLNTKGVGCVIENS